MALIVAVGGALAGVALAASATHRWQAFAVVAMAFAASEAAVVHLRLGGSTFSLTFHEAVLVLALWYVSPGEIVLSVVIGSLPALLMQGLPWLKVVFNVGQYMCWAGAAALLTHSHIGGAEPSDGWPLVGIVVLALSLVTLALIAVAIKLADGTSILTILRDTAAGSVATSLLSTSLGLVVVPLSMSDRARVLLVLPIALAVFLGNRAFHRARTQVRQLQLLQRVVEHVSRHGDPADALESFARECVDAFGALGAVVVADRHDGEAIVITARQGGALARLAVDTQLHAGILSVAIGGQGGVVLRRDSGLLSAIFDDELQAEAVLVARIGDRGAVIALTQAATPQPFSRADADFLAALSAHVAVVLDGRELRAEHEGIRREHGELRRRAERDTATGALSRYGIEQVLDARLEVDEPGPWGAIGVRVAGLDDIADLHGAEAVEEVAQAMYRRIRSLTRPGDDVARTEPASFVILTSDVVDPSDLRALSGRLASQLAAPYRLSDGSGTVTITAEAGEILGEPTDTCATATLSRLDDELYRRRLVRRLRL